MPNFDKREIEDDLEVAARVTRSVERLVATYRQSLDKLRLIRQEFQVDDDLRKKVMNTPDSMSRMLIDRGIPEPLAYSMAAEDFHDRDFETIQGGLGIWTWSCCCTACCLTSCDCTIVTVKS